MTIFNIKTKKGKTVSYDSDQLAGKGARKIVYFSPDRSYVVAFYKGALDPEDRQRIESIINQYTKSIFEQDGGDYWKEILCWMTDSFEFEGKSGIVLPAYPKQFIFEFGSFENDKCRIRGKDKRAKWFTSPTNRFKVLNPKERGNDWKKYLQSCLCIARGVQRLHASGLAHGDLSYNNVLVDPLSGTAHIIDIDELIVPNKFSPRVLGSVDFTAPEVVATKHFRINDINRNKPSIRTDCHALAVLIYHLLLCRHPLRGSKCHDPEDSTLDETLLMGKNALFIEHPTDTSNRPSIRKAESFSLPWVDVQQIPYTITGPYLKELFDKAFIETLHVPQARPTASDWQMGLIRTRDLLLPCPNPSCQQKWFVFDHIKSVKCPFCGSVYTSTVPVLEFHSKQPKADDFRSENIRFVVHHNQYFYRWHTDKSVFPNEKLKSEQKKPIGYFSFHQGKWVFVNQNLHCMATIDSETGQETPIECNSMFELKNKQWIVFSTEGLGRRALVKFHNNH